MILKMAKIGSITRFAVGISAACSIVSSGVFAKGMIQEVFPERIQAPALGFDDNDNVEIVVSGKLPNSCWMEGPTTIDWLPSKTEFRVRQYIRKKEDKLCADEGNLPPHLMVQKPFFVTRSLGQLSAAKYQAIYKTATGDRSSSLDFDVARAMEVDVDALNYAQTTNVAVSPVVNVKDEVQLLLTGTLNSGCVELDSNVRINRQNDVIVVQPVNKIVSKGVCTYMLRPFMHTVSLGKLAAGHYLIHVRAWPGKSVNQVVEVQE